MGRPGCCSSGPGSSRRCAVVRAARVTISAPRLSPSGCIAVVEWIWADPASRRPARVGKSITGCGVSCGYPDRRVRIVRRGGSAALPSGRRCRVDEPDGLLRWQSGPNTSAANSSSAAAGPASRRVLTHSGAARTAIGGRRATSRGGHASLAHPGVQKAERVDVYGLLKQGVAYFGATLRRWRDRVAPEAVGVPVGGRRRAAVRVAWVVALCLARRTRAEHDAESNPARYAVLGGCFALGGWCFSRGGPPGRCGAPRE